MQATFQIIGYRAQWRHALAETLRNDMSYLPIDISTRVQKHMGVDVAGQEQWTMRLRLRMLSCDGIFRCRKAR
jgi:hypothetical protein